ncbi:Crp/Fnr family transcriptional regulator [Chryseobacterium indoltheticum]|uniref:Crp/Fnr family transcriptional regulator n=1 Tax=Chryseobacterium indoltheticum TaxID=254 RepID=UPI003F498F8B
MYRKTIVKKFGFLGKDFLNEFEYNVLIKNVGAKDEIMREGQRNRFVPILSKGSLKVFSLNDGNEFIHYYVKPCESCSMTFSSIFSNYISSVYSVAVKDSQLILIPVEKLHQWLLKYPEINKVFYLEYKNRLSDIVSKVNNAMYYKLDKRILNFIKDQVQINHGNPLRITHQEIANNLGTSREVVSRILKNLENEGDILKTKNGIIYFEKNNDW